MTDQQINEAIARKCGLFNRSPDQTVLYQRPDEGGWYYQLVKFSDGSERPCYVGPFPDYCGDLNAMHEAEGTITGQEWTSYAIFLERREGKSIPMGINVSCVVDYWLMHATAHQRAEAFLRTLGLWKD